VVFEDPHRTEHEIKKQPSSLGIEGCDLEARAGVEPTYTDLQRIYGHNLSYKSIGYKSENHCATICVIIILFNALLK